MSIVVYGGNVAAAARDLGITKQAAHQSVRYDAKARERSRLQAQKAAATRYVSYPRDGAP